MFFFYSFSKPLNAGFFMFINTVPTTCSINTVVVVIALKERRLNESIRRPADVRIVFYPVAGNAMSYYRQLLTRRPS